MQKTRILAPLLGLVILAGCADDPTASRPLPPATPEAPRAVGMVEITLTGIGTPQMSAVASGASTATIAARRPWRAVRSAWPPIHGVLR